MTPEQRQTLHRILLDAKAEIKDGKLYDRWLAPCSGICDYVALHSDNQDRDDIDAELDLLIEKSGYKLKVFNYSVAPPFDFSHPDRLELLDWLINETKP